MKTDPKKPADIDAYIAGFPLDVQARLQSIRTTIRKAAPDAEETIKYAIPTFTLDGNLIFFAAFTNHISVYPAPRGNEQFQAELAEYEGGKGTVRFPNDPPIPLDLVRRIVEFRVKANREQAARKRRKRSS